MAERISFSYEVVRCSIPPPGMTCKDKTAMGELLDEVYFTLYHLDENVAFGDPTNIGMRPIKVSDRIHS